MARNTHYDILFEPIKIGPVTAKNRFYQVPHCAGLGHRYPFANAELRKIKAEGGWAVVCTEESEIHHSSDISPSTESRIWDEKDIPALQLLTDGVHQHGGLAGIELVYIGYHGSNRYSREIPMAPSHTATDSYEPVQARAMDRQDIRNLRRWHKQAALRARDAGFDIVYAYAGHDMSLPMHFMSKRHNQRSDEYGGSLENRVRLFRELIEETKDAVGDTCAVAVRLAVDELLGDSGINCDGEGKEIVAMLAELPDLWDVNISGWSNDSMTSRFSSEGFQEQYTAFVKSMTTKPVVGVGRFTSPDAMVDQIRRGVLDFIGAARPSIADPFLPAKIDAGRENDIRECIGCNICVASDNVVAPIRCTQNPTAGEEWRRGWHPENIQPAISKESALIIGGGPAGLECARALAQRGYQTTLADSRAEIGGRVALESRLPGLSNWIRVRDYRTGQLDQITNAQVFTSSTMDATLVEEFSCEHIVLATGSHWRQDGKGRQHKQAVSGLESFPVFTPDDLLSQAFSIENLPTGSVAIFDDDHYYMGGVLAEKLARAGRKVILITPANEVSTWTQYTLEQDKIQTRLLELDVQIIQQRRLSQVKPGQIELACIYTGRTETIESQSIVLITERTPERELFDELMSRKNTGKLDQVKSIKLIGDALAPGTIAAAVYGGHRCAREFETEIDVDTAPFRREMPWFEER
ncbi:MAG: dimethylamine/trimethylamine dehydrogenase [Parasphingorhabdus sp.]|jgi:dimethylamine/trimethylamine dehydrogenase